jgi:TRAP-type C4-dicarboxylate transport system substrate-binding protein
MRAAAKEAVAAQRIAAVAEDAAARKAIADSGGNITALTADEHSAFAAAVRPLYGEARQMYPPAGIPRTRERTSAWPTALTF